MSDITIRVRDRFLFSGTSWRISAGENWAVIGPNGAGKTSLVGALTGTVPVVGGTITIADRLRAKGKIGHLSFERQRELIASEEERDESRYFAGRFSNGLTTQTLLAGAHRSERMPSPQFGRIVAKLGLHHLLHRKVRTLSTGEIRLVMIARELLKAPRLLILDEPFGGLDPGGRHRLARTIDELMREGVQVIMVTHHLEEIGSRITHILAVKNGQLFYTKPRQQGLDPEQIQLLYADASGRIETTPPAGPPTAQPSARDAIRVCVEMKNVSIRYGGRSILKNLSWTVGRKENWAITGPNGAGKTTLLRLITADHPQAYANEIFLFGRRRGSGESIWDIKKRIGMISSEFHIRYRKPISAFDVVLSGFFDSVGLYRTATAGQRDLAARWMQKLQIADMSGRLFQTLSQGEQRKVLLARAMIKSPLLLILDEPCQGLDPSAREQMLRLIDRIGHGSVTQLLYVTHRPAETLSCITHELRFIGSKEDGFQVVQRRHGRRMAADLRTKSIGGGGRDG